MTEAYTPHIRPLVRLELMKALSSQESFQQLLIMHRGVVSEQILKLQGEFENIRAAH